MKKSIYPNSKNKNALTKTGHSDFLCKNCSNNILGTISSHSNGSLERLDKNYIGYDYYCPLCYCLKRVDYALLQNKIETKTVKNVVEFLEAIRSVKHAKWFRGVYDSNLPLKSNIGRLDVGESVASALKRECKLFYEFKRYIPYFKNDISGIELAFLGQHYGLLTRLLDWTSSPLVALFFATKKKEHDGAVYILKNIKQANSDFSYESIFANIEIYNDKFKTNSPMHSSEYKTNIILPNAVTSRLITQSGAFTLQTDPFVPLIKEIQLRVVIPHEYKSEISLSLEQLGIHDFSLFPDISGLASWLGEKYWHNRDKSPAVKLPELACQPSIRPHRNKKNALKIELGTTTIQEQAHMPQKALKQ